MSDLYLEILKTQLDRFHAILKDAVPDSDEYFWCLVNIDKCMDAFTGAQPQEDLVESTITKLLEEAPTGEAQ